MSLSVNLSSSSTDRLYPLIAASSVQGKEEVSEHAPIQLLPLDVLGIIFHFATNRGRDGKALSSIRAVNSEWRNIVDITVLGPCWGRLQQRIENPTLQVVVASSVFVERFVAGVIRSALGAEADGWDTGNFARFSHLTQELRAKGAPIPNAHAVFGFECSAYDEMGCILDDSLVTLWERVQGQARIHFEEGPVPNDAQEIRQWLDDPANGEKIAQVTRLNLSGTRLNLSGNLLTAFPAEMGCFSHLTELNLYYNQLTRLPETIGRLTKLRVLSLDSNKLISLPETIGMLSQLEELYLSYNQLVRLPGTIGNLSKLKKLYLERNPLTSLPESICKLVQLEALLLDPDVFFFVLDRDFQSRRAGYMSLDQRRGLTYRDIAEKYRACASYVCRSALASLCQEIHRDSEEQVLRNAFEKLSDEMQQSIRQEAVDALHPHTLPSEVPDLFADRAQFVEAVGRALKRKLYSFSHDQCKQLYRNVWDLAGQSENADRQGVSDGFIHRWGETHAEENIIRLIDAMELVVKNPSF